jgi:hypothetical protein
MKFNTEHVTNTQYTIELASLIAPTNIIRVIIIAREKRNKKTLLKFIASIL